MAIAIHCMCCGNIGPGSLSRYSDSLRAGRSRNRIPVAARFSAPVLTGPGAHPASYTMGTGSLPRCVKQPVRGADHPPPSNAEVKESVQLYVYSTSGPSCPVRGGYLHLRCGNTCSLKGLLAPLEKKQGGPDRGSENLDRRHISVSACTRNDFQPVAQSLRLDNPETIQSRTLA